MDENSLNELLECSVCLERLDASSKVLPCQHTFCRRCLEEIVSTKNELRCPECRTLVDIRVEDLPANILLIRLLEGMKNAKAGIGGSPLSMSMSALESPTSTSSGSSSPLQLKQFSPGSASGGIRTSPGHKSSTNSQPCAKALYCYEAKEPGDLSFKKGDTIILRKQVDENWYHGELNNQHGFFPATYVQVITALPQEIPKCKALYDFILSDKNEKDCLTFQKDDVLTVIRRVDDNWAEGKLGERIGIFPISFVEMNDAAKWLINNQAAGLLSSRVIPGHAGMTSSGGSSNGNHGSGNNNGSNASGSGSSPDTPTTTTTAASMIAITTSAVTMPVSNPSILAVQRAGQKRHSLTAIGGHKLTAAQQLGQHQHRHSMELSGSSLSSTLAAMSTSLVVASSSTHASPRDSSNSKPQVLPQVNARQGSSSSSPAGGDSAATTSSQSGNGASIPSIYVALYNYKPRKDDEVELRKGDYYTVTEKCQDGWFKGTCLRTGNVGVFPGNYVQLVKYDKLSSKHGNSSSSSSSSSSPAVGCGQQAGPVTGPVSGPLPGPLPGPLTNPKPPHVTVSRAHSFPKTSPLATAGLDYQVRPGSQGVTRAPNVTVCEASSPGGVTTPTRSTSRPQCGNSLRSQAISGVAGINNDKPTSSRSPRTSRKSAERKHRDVERHRNREREHRDREREREAGSSLTPVTHSMMTNNSITPPNVVIGAVGGGDAPSSSSSHKEHREHKEHKKEKKEKDKLSLVKRLTKSKKSKSPPPPPPGCEAPEGSSAEATPQHHRYAKKSRSGSLPTESPVEGATAAVVAPVSTPQHQKSRSLDSNTHPPSKPTRTKPLLRERYRCIVPYPPQSDIELELKVGDIVYVHKKRDDGWYKGTLQRTGKTGLFPGSFVDSF